MLRVALPCAAPPTPPYASAGTMQVNSLQPLYKVPKGIWSSETAQCLAETGLWCSRSHPAASEGDDIPYRDMPACTRSPARSAWAHGGELPSGPTCPGNPYWEHGTATEMLKSLSWPGASQHPELHLFVNG